MASETVELLLQRLVVEHLRVGIFAGARLGFHALDASEPALFWALAWFAICFDILLMVVIFLFRFENTLAVGSSERGFGNGVETIGD